MLIAVVRANNVRAAVEQPICVADWHRVVVVDVAVVCITREQERVCIATSIIVTFSCAGSIGRSAHHSNRTKVGVGIATPNCVPRPEGAVASDKGLVTVCSWCGRIIACRYWQSLLRNQHQINHDKWLVLTAVAVVFRDGEMVAVALAVLFGTSEMVAVVLAVISGKPGVVVVAFAVFFG